MIDPPNRRYFLGLFALFFLLVIGMPIGFALAFVGFWGISFMTDISVALPTLIRSFSATFSTYSFSVIPLFVLMGELATVSGLSHGIYRVADKWLRRLPGGLGIATIGACAGFSAICGSSVATAATLGRVALPEMEKYGYDQRLATGSVAAGGTLGFLIPPSIGFVVYGILTEQSIGKLLISGFIPGFMLTLAYAVIVSAWATMIPTAAPQNPTKVPLKEKLHAITAVWELIIVFLLVMGGIYAGVFTPTEAGAMGAFFLLVVTLSKGRLTLTGIITALKETDPDLGNDLYHPIRCLYFHLLHGPHHDSHHACRPAERHGPLPIPHFRHHPDGVSLFRMLFRCHLHDGVDPASDFSHHFKTGLRSHLVWCHLRLDDGSRPHHPRLWGSTSSSLPA